LVSVIHDSETYPSTARDGGAPATRPRRPLRVEKNTPLLLLDESQLKKHPLYPKEGASREKEEGFSPLSVDHPSRTIARRPRALDASAARTSARSMMSNIIHHPIASSFDVHRRRRRRGHGRSSLAIAHPSSGRPSFFSIFARALASSNETYLLPCGRQTIMDLALDTLPVETATVLATCAEAWVTADMMIFDRARLCRLVRRPSTERRVVGGVGVGS